jgi:hypothetical protein
MERADIPLLLVDLFPRFLESFRHFEGFGKRKCTMMIEQYFQNQSRFSFLIVYRNRDNLSVVRAVSMPTSLTRQGSLDATKLFPEYYRAYSSRDDTRYTTSLENLY